MNTFDKIIPITNIILDNQTLQLYQEKLQDVGNDLYKIWIRDIKSIQSASSKKLTFWLNGLHNHEKIALYYTALKHPGIDTSFLLKQLKTFFDEDAWN